MEGTTDIQQDSGTVGISEMSFGGSQENWVGSGGDIKLEAGRLWQ